MKAAIGISVVLCLCLHAEVLAAEYPEGTHVLTMVVRVASLEEIMTSGESGLLGQLRAHGIADNTLSDGSAAAGIVYCCGGKISKDTMILFYVDPDFRVAVGDIVEISLGRVPSKKQRKAGDRGTINQAVRVRESFEEAGGRCRWDPEDDALWMRVLYCSWMLGEEWQYRGGLSKGWFKPPATD